MKQISTLFLLLFLVHFLSGCSNTYRSNTSILPDTKKTEVKKVAAVVKPKAKVVKKSPTPISQKAKSNVVAKQNPRSRLINIAHSTIGRPYKYGGITPKGFDCSGLMNYVHKRSLGIDIPRTAAEQQRKSRTVQYKNLQVGDMLFFKINRRTNHVGIYIGDRKFIHAGSKNKNVTIASMDSPYWHKRFVKFGSFL